MPPSPPRRPRRTLLPQAGDRPPRKVSVLSVRSSVLTRFVVWGVLATGPVALLAHYGRPDPAVPRQPVSLTRTVQPEAPAEAGPAGYAELLVGLWLEAGSGPQSAAARQLRLLAPSVRPPEWGQHAVTAGQVTTVRTVRQGEGRWSVTIAARLTGTAEAPEGERPAGLRYFTLPVVLQDPDRTGGALGPAAAGAPMEIAGPSAGQMPDSSLNSAVGDGPLADSVRGFLTAFLGAEGSAERYLAPGVILPRPDAGGYIAVEVDQLLADRRTDGPDASRDGAAVRVHAEVTATDSAGRKWPLSYALDLTARAGRWEVASFGSGLETTAMAKESAPATPAPSRSTGPAATPPAPAS
ncbi:conjugal transfer protein [Streptomyces sp. S1]|uniref:conjugal transfer protein n=1 Tax=Streptomyces sp. S1 TaxID=718288 RepID=UPI000EF812BC|nr:conjugal transfer protein [Streptomyces sp. S1]